MTQKIELKELTTEKGIVKPGLVRKALLRQGIVKVFNDALTIKNNHSYWNTYSNNKDIQRYIRKNLFTEEANNTLRADLLKSVLEDILVDHRFEIILHPAEESVIFKNTSLNFTDMKEQAPSARLFYSYRIEAEFLKNVLPSKGESILNRIASTRFAKLLDEMFPNDTNSQIRLLELLGYLLCPTTGLKKAILFIGKPNTGKSLILKILKALLPPTTVSNLDLSKIGRHNENSALLGAHLNITEDFDSNAQVDMSTLKLIIGNEVVTLSQKYQPSVSVAVRTKLILVGNAFPKIKSTEIKPFEERMLFLRFDQVALNPDRNLISKLKSELNEIATACIYAYSQALKNGFTESESSNEWFQNQLYDIQNEKLFIDDMILPGSSNTFIPIADLKKVYTIYCNTNGFTEHTFSALNNALLDASHKINRFKKNMSSKDLGNLHCYKGIQWNMDALKELDANMYNRAQQIKISFFESIEV